MASGNKDYIPGVHPVNLQPILQHFLQHYLRLPPWQEDPLYIVSDAYNPHIHDASRKGGHLPPAQEYHKHFQQVRLMLGVLNKKIYSVFRELKEADKRNVQ